MNMNRSNESDRECQRSVQMTINRGKISCLIVQVNYSTTLTKRLEPGHGSQLQKCSTTLSVMLSARNAPIISRRKFKTIDICGPVSNWDCSTRDALLSVATAASLASNTNWCGLSEDSN
jgi:hypothetical protein